MLQSWKLGTAFGIDIKVHWSFLLLLVWAFMASGMVLFPVVVLLAVFGCVVLHELGHALTARAFGIPTRDITLYPIGGVARLERMTESPWEEFWIAVAGPAVNVVIAALLAGMLAFSDHMAISSLGDVESVALPTFLFYLLIANSTLVAFNMLPAFPMDGGRVLRALLSAVIGHVRATEIAAKLGAFLALVLGTLGMLSLLGVIELRGVMLVLVAAFVYFAGQQELRAVRHRDHFRRLPPLDVVPVEVEIPTVVPADLERNFSGLVWDDRNGMWVLWRNGQPVHSTRPY